MTLFGELKVMDKINITDQAKRRIDPAEVTASLGVNLDHYSSKNYPRTADEWWDLANKYREQLRSLVRNFHPLYIHSQKMPITAPAAEECCEVVREHIRNKTVDDPLECFDQFLAQKSNGMVTLLNQVWFGIPESMDAHSLPGFSLLCDLCSECDVLGEA